MLLRSLSPADASAVHHITYSVGWIDTPCSYLEQLLRWSGNGSVGLFTPDGTLVSVGMAFRYAQRRAWIGTMVTHPDHHGKGYGQQVLEALIAHLEGVAEIVLDATVLGAKLYTKLGFHPIYSVQKWVSQHTNPPPAPATSSIRPFQPSDLPALLRLDETIFGDARPHILSDIATPSTTWVDVQNGELQGFLILKPRPEKNMNLGSWLHHDPHGAEQLLQTALAAFPDHSFTLATPHPAAATLLPQYGFQVASTCTRMVLGADPIIQNDKTYALVSMAVG